MGLGRRCVENAGLRAGIGEGMAADGRLGERGRNVPRGKEGWAY